MDIAAKKVALIDWLTTIQDQSLLEKFDVLG